MKLRLDISAFSLISLKFIWEFAIMDHNLFIFYFLKDITSVKSTWIVYFSCSTYLYLMNLCWPINFFDGHACHLPFGQGQLWFQKFRGHVNSLRFEQGPLELRNQKNSDLCFCLAKWPQNEMWKLPDINIFKKAKHFLFIKKKVD